MTGAPPAQSVTKRSHEVSRRGASDLLPEATPYTKTHLRLLEKSLVLFDAKGFHGVSVRDIATAAGIRAPSLYKHLDSKQELLVQLCILGHEEHRRRLRESLEEASKDSIEQIRSLVRAHVTMHALYPSLARVVNRELHSLTPENRAEVENIREDSASIFIRVIGAGIEEGVFRVPDRWLAVASVGAMGIRVAEWWEDFPGYSIEDVAETYAGFAVSLLTGGS